MDKENISTMNTYNNKDNIITNNDTKTNNLNTINQSNSINTDNLSINNNSSFVFNINNISNSKINIKHLPFNLKKVKKQLSIKKKKNTNNNNIVSDVLINEYTKDKSKLIINKSNNICSNNNDNNNNNNSINKNKSNYMLLKKNSNKLNCNLIYNSNKSCYKTIIDGNNYNTQLNSNTFNPIDNNNDLNTNTYKNHASNIILNRSNLKTFNSIDIIKEKLNLINYKYINNLKTSHSYNRKKETTNKKFNNICNQNKEYNECSYSKKLNIKSILREKKSDNDSKQLYKDKSTVRTIYNNNNNNTNFINLNCSDNKKLSNKIFIPKLNIPKPLFKSSKLEINKSKSIASNNNNNNSYLLKKLKFNTIDNNAFNELNTSINYNKLLFKSNSKVNITYLDNRIINKNINLNLQNTANTENTNDKDYSKYSVVYVKHNNKFKINNSLLVSPCLKSRNNLYKSNASSCIKLKSKTFNINKNNNDNDNILNNTNSYSGKYVISIKPRNDFVLNNFSFSYYSKYNEMNKNIKSKNELKRQFDTILKRIDNLLNNKVFFANNINKSSEGE